MIARQSQGTQTDGQSIRQSGELNHELRRPFLLLAHVNCIEKKPVSQSYPEAGCFNFQLVFGLRVQPLSRKGLRLNLEVPL